MDETQARMSEERATYLLALATNCFAIARKAYLDGTKANYWSDTAVGLVAQTLIESELRREEQSGVKEQEPSIPVE